MNFDEIDVALDELESRLERLRALYEQYFLGFEKIEPTVPRKDVDRRIYLLRREKIRNTGRRFKLQTIIQRYNTFQQYWQRVCREIENGTYRRHVLRAERSLGENRQLTIATRRRFGKPTIEAIAAQAAAGAAASELESLEELSPDDAVSDSVPPPAAARALPSSAPVRAKGPPARGRSSPPDKAFESLELDMGFLGSWIPPTPGASGGAAKAAPPASKAKSAPNAAPPPRPAASAKAAPPPKPGSPARAAPPKPQPEPAVPPPAAEASAAPAAAKPAVAPARPAPAKPVATRPGAAAEAARAMSDERVRELHDKLMALKRQNQESGQVSLENLARTLRDTENKLRSQHQNRKIDFDVVIRDGKAIVKPTVR